MADVVLTTGVDTSQAYTDIKRFSSQYAQEVAKLEKPSVVKVDTGAAKAAVQQLATSFGSIKSELQQSVNSQKAAMAALVASGKQGSTEYQKLAASVRQDVVELKKLEQAARSVDAEFADPIELKINTGGAEQKLSGFKALKFNESIQAVQALSSAFDEVIAAGAEYEASLAAVGAITGQSGPALDALGQKARELALQFGGSATSQLSSFQGILSKLGPQVAENADALTKLATNVNILSAASGDAADTSMNAIVDSMLQFGLVTGDSAKDAETSTRIINGLAASAQVGAAEIPQVAEAILQAGVAAKGAQLSFESANAAIQVLAVGGKTGSEAGIALRNVLGLIQKASGPAEAEMRKMGTSSKELGEILTTQGLDAALTKIKGGLNNMGSAAQKNAALMTIFGTENSAAAGILLDNVDKFKEFETGIIQGQQGMGAAFEQAAIRMDTAQTQMSKARAAITDTFISIFQTIGPGFASILGSTAKIAPLIQTFAGLKDILPEGLFTKVAGGLKSVLLPALVQLGIVKTTSTAATIAETAAEEANIVVKGQQAVATGGATVAEYALNTAMLANPAFLVVAGIAALVGAFLIFSKSTKDLEDATKDANEALAETQKAVSISSAVEKQATDLDKLSDKYTKLKGATDPQSQKDFAAATEELAKKVPEAVIEVDKLDASGRRIGTTFEVNVGVVRDFATEQQRLAKEAKTDALANLADQAAALTDSYREALDKQIELRQDKTKLDDAVASGLGGLGSTQAFGNPFESVRDDLKDVNQELVEQNKKIADARPEIAKVVTGYLAMGKSVEEITAATSLTVAEINRIDPALGTAVARSQELEKAISKAPAAQQESLRIISQQAQAYKASQDAVDDLTAKIRAQEKIGLPTEDLAKQLDEVRQKAREQKITLDATIESKGGEKFFADLPAQVATQMGEVGTIVEDSIDDIRDKAANAKLGDTLSKGFEFKEGIDQNDELGKFITKYKAAKTDAEKNSIAAEIARDIPQAITGYDRLTGQFTISTDKAEEFVAAQKKGFSDDIAKKRDEFTEGLKAQAKEYAANSDKVQELGKKIAQISAAGGDVSKYRQEWERAKQKTEENAKAIANTVEQGKKIGFVTGEVSGLGNELGLTANEADAVAQANARIESSADNAAASVKEIAAAYKAARESANGIADDTRGALLGLLLEQKKLQRIASAELTEDQAKRLKELPALILKARADGIQAVKDRKDLERLEFGVDLDLGNTERKVKSFKEQAQQVRDEIVGIQRGIRTAKIGDELQQALQEADDSLAAAQKQIKRQREKLAKDVAEARKDPAQSVEGSGALDQALQDKSVELAALTEQKKEKIRADARKKRLEEFKRQLADESKAQEENTKTAIELLKIEEESISGESSAALQLRFESRQKISELQQQVEIDSLVRGNAEYVATYADLAEQRAILASSTATTAEKAGARARITTLEQGLKDVEARLRSSDARISATRRKYEAERNRDQATTAAAIANKAEEERLSQIVDDLERERQTRLSALEARLKQELIIASDNEELKTAALKRAAQERYKIEQEFREKSDSLYFSALQFLRAFNASKFDEERLRRDVEISEERSKLNQQERDLEESFLRRKIKLQEYNQQASDIQRQRAELDGKAAENEFDLWKSSAAAAAEAFTSIQKRFQDTTNERVGTSAAAIDQVVKSGIETGESAGETAKKVFAQLEDVGVNALATVGAQLAQLALGTKQNLGEIASAISLTLISIAENAVAANIVAIYAFAIGQLGLFGGIAAATAAVALVEGLLAIAKAKLQENIPKFAYGGYTGDGGKWEFAGVVHKGEFVMDQEHTERWRHVLEGIQSDRIRHPQDLSRLSVGRDGGLWDRSIERAKESRYERRMRQQTVSPIVIVMREQASRPVSMAGVEDRLSRLEKSNAATVQLLDEQCDQLQVNNNHLKKILEQPVYKFQQDEDVKAKEKRRSWN